MNTPSLSASLEPFGLRLLGACAAVAGDNLPDTGTLYLIGPEEPRFWPIFTASPEYIGGAPDPLDRWSHRVLTALAHDHDGMAVFPFGGPPFHPIMTWALRTGRFWHSPIGFLVHDDAGLFVSFRGAILLPDQPPEEATSAQPCLTCAAPCATACPVDAFADGYDVAACKAHIASPEGRDCRDQGCRARRACPVGQGRRLAAQAAFHMEAFI